MQGFLEAEERLGCVGVGLGEEVHVFKVFSSELVGGSTDLFFQSPATHPTACVTIVQVLAGYA